MAECGTVSPSKKTGYELLIGEIDKYNYWDIMQCQEYGHASEVVRDMNHAFPHVRHNLIENSTENSKGFRYHVGVRFVNQDSRKLSEKSYTYTTKLSGIAVGEFLIVRVGSRYKLVIVDNDCVEHPEQNRTIKPIICAVRRTLK